MTKKDKKPKKPKVGGSSSSSSGGGGGGGEWEDYVDPAQIRFTHAKIRPVFSDGKVVQETYNAIERRELPVEDLPKITIIQQAADQYYSLNNRRLWVLKQCRQNGLLKDNRVLVRVRPMPTSKRLQNKFDVTRCCDTARFMKEKAVRQVLSADDASDATEPSDHQTQDTNQHDIDSNSDNDQQDGSR
jgi:hypothetical protein